MGVVDDGSGFLTLSNSLLRVEVSRASMSSCALICPCGGVCLRDGPRRKGTPRVRTGKHRLVSVRKDSAPCTKEKANAVVLASCERRLAGEKNARKTTRVVVIGSQVFASQPTNK